MDFKSFKLSNLAIDNRISVYLITFLLTLTGIFSYINLPKEQFPEVEIPYFFITSVQAGSSPSDVENLITRPIEQELRSIEGIEEISSISKQAYSIIIVEFDVDKDPIVGKQEVKDAVDEARSELPTEMTEEPDVREVNLADQPILNVNISGDFGDAELKSHAETIQDELESLSPINRVELVGSRERQIQINVDLAKMEASGVSFNMISEAVGARNLTISAGNIDMGRMERAMRIDGEIDEPEELNSIVINNNRGKKVYLRDIAEIKDGFADRESYARLDESPVITLNVIKRSGENLIGATEQTIDVVDRLHGTKLPENLEITYTNDRSDSTRNAVSNLFNTVILGFFFVVLVLMFFMGIKNAMFVGLVIPLSSLLAFAVMPMIDYSINMVVLFALIMGLGIVVDNAIVVVENIFRFITTKSYDKAEGTKRAVGQVAIPVIAGTLTTIAPFIPLMFWGGIIGKFFGYLPVTLILTLTASLLIALVINPVFAVTFMKQSSTIDKLQRPRNRILLVAGAILILVSIVFYMTGQTFIANLIIFIFALYLIALYLLEPAIEWFEEDLLPKLKGGYEKLIAWILEGKKPYGLLGITIIFLILSIWLISIFTPNVVFFPQSEPNFVYIYNKMPVGTDIEETNRVTKQIENRVYEVIGKDNPVVKSVITNVAEGAAAPNDQDQTNSPNKSKVTVAFVDYQYRGDVSTERILNDIRDNLDGIPSAEIVAEREQQGPPTGMPINIEITGEDIDRLAELSTNFRDHIEEQNIRGIEELRMDLQINNPEVRLDVDTEKAQSLGLSHAQIGTHLRTALLGADISTYREGEDEYDINLRLQEEDRENVTELVNSRLMTPQGGYVPISSVVDVDYTSTYGAIFRKDLDRVVTISSNVLSGYNANVINDQIRDEIDKFDIPDGYNIQLTGEQEEQAETSSFLGLALLVAVGLIFLILVMQFNSISKTLIIMSQVVFSLIGVFIGFVTFGLEISIVQTGMGIIAVAGIVVKNGIILIDYIDEQRKMNPTLKDAIIKAGYVRLTPVLLTAASTILGLIPLAIGMNIDFYTLFAEFNPQLFFGGDSADFWGPLAWTIIFGLGFATFLTLLLVPSMYLIGYEIKHKVLGLIRS